MRVRSETTVSPHSIRDNFLRVQERIAAAAQKAGRRAEEITLIAVSKTHPAEAIRMAYAAGLRHFGENRVQEWEGKRAAVGDLPAAWHLVGHLQSNKAARAAGLFHAVDSVDDLALAQRLDRARSELNAREKLRILLEVRLAGLMCIPPFLEASEEVRPHFRRLRELRDHLATQLGRPLPVVSMGMSHDFEIAIEEGATEVRLGTAIFGERAKK